MPLSWSYIDTRNSGVTIRELSRYLEQWCHYQGTIQLLGTVVPLLWNYLYSRNSGAINRELYSYQESNGSTMKLYRQQEQWCHYHGTIQILGTGVPLSGNYLDTRNSGATIMELYRYQEQRCRYQGTIQILGTMVPLSGNYIVTRNSGATIM